MGMIELYEVQANNHEKAASKIKTKNDDVSEIVVEMNDGSNMKEDLCAKKSSKHLGYSFNLDTNKYVEQTDDNNITDRQNVRGRVEVSGKNNPNNARPKSNHINNEDNEYGKNTHGKFISNNEIPAIIIGVDTDEGKMEGGNYNMTLILMVVSWTLMSTTINLFSMERVPFGGSLYYRSGIRDIKDKREQDTPDLQYRGGTCRKMLDSLRYETDQNNIKSRYGGGTCQKMLGSLRCRKKLDSLRYQTDDQIKMKYQ